jgi:hypothetical protein
VNRLKRIVRRQEIWPQRLKNVITLVVVAAWLGGSGVWAQSDEAPLAGVLARAGAYVQDFQEHLAGIVAEEKYVQDAIPDSSVAPVAGLKLSNPRQHRELISDLLLVRPKGADRWVQFRDVYEVDGQPVRDRDQRLTKLFVAPWSSISAQVKQIADESARFNIGSLDRNINVPVLPLLFLEPELRPRFEFARVALSNPLAGQRAAVPRALPDRPAFAIPPTAWEIRYREMAQGTMIRTSGDRDMPASGRFWLEPGTGRVLMTEFLLEDPLIRASIVVSYQSKPVAGFLVPLEMREDYFLTSSKVKITGSATYAKFRTFQVNTDETIDPKSAR